MDLYRKQNQRNYKNFSKYYGIYSIILQERMVDIYFHILINDHKNILRPLHFFLQKSTCRLKGYGNC